jgi:sepiapterin reductase
MCALLTLYYCYPPLGDVTQLVDNSKGLFDRMRRDIEGSYSRVIFINNAGSLGTQDYVGSATTAEQVDAYLSSLHQNVTFNITSCCFLTSEVVRRVKSVYSPLIKCSIVNVSSLTAVQPFNTWSMYCSGKAARDMFHRTVALENKDSTRLRVLNYAPGAMDTNMQKEIRESPTIHKEYRDMFIDMLENNKYVDPHVSSSKMVKVILFEAFESGAHIDFYDVVEGIDTVAAPTTCCACDHCTCGVDCKCKEMKSVGKGPACGSCEDFIAAKMGNKK